MGRRLLLQNKLVGIIGNEYVYYQPPASLKLFYPCIVYSLENIQSDYADNTSYKKMDRYQVTVIDRNPESPTPNDIFKLPMASHNTRFAKDGLYHDVFTIYF